MVTLPTEVSASDAECCEFELTHEALPPTMSAQLSRLPYHGEMGVCLEMHTNARVLSPIPRHTNKASLIKSPNIPQEDANMPQLQRDLFVDKTQGWVFMAPPRKDVQRPRRGSGVAGHSRPQHTITLVKFRHAGRECRVN